MDEPVSAALARLLAAGSAGSPRAHDQDPETVLLQSVVDTAATLFGAEAASIALFERAPDRLEFRVASGAQGAGVVGLSIPHTRGVAGYVFSTGEAIALSDVSSDPRFDRATAERTGYVPRSIAAVPLSDEGSTVGVLQVLDKRGSARFSLRDMTMLGIFAAQAAVAIRASRVSRGARELLRAALAQVAAGRFADADLDALFASTAGTLDGEDGPPFWRLVDRLSMLRRLPDGELALIIDILDVVERHRGAGGTYRRRGR